VCTHFGIHSVWVPKGSGNLKPFPKYIRMKKKNKNKNKNIMVYLTS
jgi:hypothetical protein